MEGWTRDSDLGDGLAALVLEPRERPRFHGPPHHDDLAEPVDTAAVVAGASLCRDTRPHRLRRRRVRLPREYRHLGVAGGRAAGEPVAAQWVQRKRPDHS